MGLAHSHQSLGSGPTVYFTCPVLLFYIKVAAWDSKTMPMAGCYKQPRGYCYELSLNREDLTASGSKVLVNCFVDTQGAGTFPSDALAKCF